MERFNITQTMKEQEINNINNEKIKKQWKSMEEKGINIYENQEKSGKELVEKFINDKTKILSLVILPPQGGKTGILCSSIKEFMNMGTPYENIFIITGLSSLEWKTQTKNRIPEELHKNIYHRQDLEKHFIENIKDKQNVVILIDEIQIGCTELQTLATVFEKANLFDINNLLKNDIKIIQFSATPNGILYDTMGLETHSFIKVCKPGLKYIGCKELLEANRIYDINEDTLENNIKKHLENYKRPKYHFIRIHKGESIKFITKFINIFSDCNYIEYTQEGVKPEELDEILLEEPDIHTFVFIKERARCAKTFNKKHIGLWYERRGEKVLDDVITQGLLGRACGYDDNGESIIFTHKDSVEKYIKLIDSNFEDLETTWVSNSTFTLEGIIESKGTLNYLINDGDNYKETIKSIEFNTYEEACSWSKEHFPNSRKFNIMCSNSKGFYNGGSATKYKVVQYSDININKILCKHETHKLVRCYIDKKNKETLRYVIYYKD